MHTIKKNTESFVVASKETGLEENVDKTNYMVMSRDQNAGRRHSTKIDNSSSEGRGIIRTFGKKNLTDQNSIQKEIKSRMKLRNVCYLSVQNLLSSCLVSKNIKIMIYITIIFSLVFYVYETWPLKFREERRLRALEHRVLRRIFGPKGDEVTGEWIKLNK